MPVFIDRTGQVFGRLTVIERAPNRRQQVYWWCLCSCGNKICTQAGALHSGHTKSCGCFHKEVSASLGKASATHGKTKTRTYKSWGGMMSRCRDKNNPKYPIYGGRGITVCKRWENFENFLFDMGVVPVGMSIDRIENNGNYEPGNCRWATAQQQRRNTSLSKLDVGKVAKIKRLLLDGATQTALGSQFGVSQVMIGCIARGKAWADIEPESQG